MIAPGSSPGAAPRMRRERSATESLLSIALLLEAILIFFVVMAAFGLKLLPAGMVFFGGAVFFALLLIAGRMVRRQAGIWLGWGLQLALIALGLLLPEMYFVGGIFIAIWTYCFFTGRRLDRRKANFFATFDQPPTN